MANALTLPKTLTEFMSPEGKSAIATAERILNALQSTTFIIVDTSGKEHRGALEFGAASATVRIKL
jgi:hypothetical protein